MDFISRAQFEIVQMEHAERMREAERFRRAFAARQDANPKPAARRERRFFVFPRIFNRASEA